MTNGEVLQKTFPNSELETLSTKIVFTLEPKTLGQQVFVFDKDWWDAEYKEPTTMNNLAQERYQDLIEYFGSKEVAKAILGSRKEFKAWLERLRWNVKKADELARELEQIKGTTKNDLAVREFEEIEVSYPADEICIYPEYKGKPYFAIKYKENGEEIVGYGTYKPKVLSRYLKDFFISTTKNDLPHCNHADEEIAKSFIEDVEAVKEHFPCGEQMDFPKSFDDFVKDYGFKDKEEVYTNGSELISVFRVKQWLEHISTTKNDLGVDLISREDALNEFCIYNPCDSIGVDKVRSYLKALPSVTPQLSSGLEKNSKELEKDFGELELDCISRADAIRVASGYCHPSNVAKELAKLPSMGRYDPYTDKFIKE